MPIYHIYIVHIGVINIFCYISRSDHCEVLYRSYLFKKIWQKDKGKFFRNVRACNIFQRFPRVNGQFFQTSFAGIFRNIFFLQCDSIQLQCPRNSQWEVHMKCWQNLWKLSLMMKLILQLICIISSNPQPSPCTPFPQVSHLSPGRTTSKTPLLQTHHKQSQCVSFPQF